MNLAFIVVALFVLLPLSCLALRAEIRRARIPNDLPSMTRCRETAFSDVSEIRLPSQTSFVNCDQLTRPDSEVVGVVATSPIAGVLGTADVNTRTNVINNVFVTPDARGRGIGRSLMEHAESILGRGATAKLEVGTNNESAVRLYESMGYKTRGIDSAVFGLALVTSLQMKVQMTKDL